MAKRRHHGTRIFGECKVVGVSDATIRKSNKWFPISSLVTIALSLTICLQFAVKYLRHSNWGYRGGSPTAVRPSDPALCESCPLVTPYYCRLGDLLCFMCVYRFVCALLSLHVCLCCFRCLICLL